MKNKILSTLAAPGIFLVLAAPASADFGSSQSLGFRTASERLAQVSAENMRIAAENVTFQQQFLVESLQRGQIINNMILINQFGNGSIDLDAHQTNSGRSSISNDIDGSIGIR